MDTKQNVEDEESIVASSSSTNASKKLPNYPGPKPNVNYPLTVIYCGGKSI
jgi:hypothetical protein